MIDTRVNTFAVTPLRSVLFMPASNGRAIAKARALPCDAVILDLEDAVAPEGKADARAAAVAAVREGGFGGRTVAIRINALDTRWGRDDAAALAGIAAVDAVVVPKVNGATALRDARALLGQPLWAMVETCAGVLALSGIAEAARAVGLGALIAGTNDLAKEMRCRPDPARAPLLPVLTQIVLAARAGGVAALDGVLNAIDDPDRLAAECRQGATLGFDGKTLIHPAQIEIANATFGPGEDQLAWARSVVAAFAEPGAAGRGAIQLDGAMVERLHLAEAKRILEMAIR